MPSMNDLILVSVDDHVVEPPDVFHPFAPGPVQGARTARDPEQEGRRTSGPSKVACSPTSVSTPSPAARPTNTAWSDVVPPDAQGLLRRARPHRRHERQRRPRLDVLLVVPRPLRPAVGAGGRQGSRRRGVAGLQRLAHRGVVRRVSRSLPAARHDPDVGSEARRRRGAASRAQGLSRDLALRETRSPEGAELPQRRVLGSDLEACVDEGTAVCIHIGRAPASRRRRWTRRSTRRSWRRR